MQAGTKLICGFPGNGAPEFIKKYKREYNICYIDIDDYMFIKQPNGCVERNPKYPNNYMDAIYRNYSSKGYEFIIFCVENRIVDELLCTGVKLNFMHRGRYTNNAQIWCHNRKLYTNDSEIFKYSLNSHSYIWHIDNICMHGNVNVIYLAMEELDMTHVIINRPELLV